MGHQVHQWRREKRQDVEHTIPGATLRPSKVAVADFVGDSRREHRHEQRDARGIEPRQYGGKAEAHGGVQQPPTPGGFAGAVGGHRASSWAKVEDKIDLTPRYRVKECAEKQILRAYGAQDDRLDALRE